MQVVDVLRDHRRRLAGAMEARQRKMSASRLGGGELHLHGEAPAPGLVAHLLAGEEFLKRDRAVFDPESAGRTKVGNPTLGGNSGAGEWRDHASRPHEFVQLVDSSLKIG